LWAILLLMVVATGLVVFLLRPKVELSKIKIADTTILTSIAIGKGSFKEEGLQVEWVTGVLVLEDSPSGLLAGKVDYAGFQNFFAKPFIEAILRNAPIKIIMFTARHEAYSLVAQPGLKLNDLKTIAIFSQYDSIHYQILKFIEKNNLEITIITPKTQGDFWNIEKLNNLLLSGEVDAILTFPENAPSLQAQGFSILDTLIDESPSCLIVRNDKIEKKPEEVQKVVRVLGKTMEIIVSRPEETKGLLLKSWNPAKTPKENLAIIDNYYPFLKAAYDRKNIPIDEGAELLIKIVKAGEFETTQEVEEQIVTPEDLQKVFDFRFVK